MELDLLLKGGRVLDPSRSFDAPADVGFKDGHVAAVDRDLPTEGARQVLDVAGKIVTPGLVDLHTHVYWGVTGLGIEHDPVAARSGTTTWVDAGSSGAITFPGFRRYIVERSLSRTLCFLNVSSHGIIDAQLLGECADIRWLDTGAAIRTVEANRDVILGIKVRSGQNSVGQSGSEPAWIAREVAEAAGVPLMLHIGRPPPALCRSLEVLRPGDILTHAFNGLPNCVIGRDGRVRREFWDLRDAGVWVDVGHGSGSFSFRTAEQALAEGFYPDSISTDLYQANLAGPVFDQVTTLSKFLALGMSLPEVILRATHNPARMVGREGEFGGLRPGIDQDAAVLELQHGPVCYMDSEGQAFTASVRLVAWRTIRRGTLMEAPLAARVRANGCGERGSEDHGRSGLGL